MIWILEGDPHLYDQNIGFHKDYPNECIKLFEKTNERAKEVKQQGKEVGIISLGDLTEKRIRELEYRYEVQSLLKKRQEITNGNSVMIKGNHDINTSGMSDYDYFYKSGFFERKEKLGYKDMNIYLMDYEDKDTKFKDLPRNKINILLAHNQIQWLKSMPIFEGMVKGKDYILLDKNENFKGFDYIICGHIHQYIKFEGELVDGKKCQVIYTGSPTRLTSIDKQEYGNWVIIDTDNNKVWEEQYKLPDYNEVFDTSLIEIENQKKKIKKQVTIKDILQNLDNYEMNSGEIKKYIREIKEVEEEVKNKAIEYIEKGELIK